MAEEKSGSITSFITNQGQSLLNVFSCPIPTTTKQDEHPMTTGVSGCYNTQVIPRAALKTILRCPKLVSQVNYNDADVDSGHLSGMVFVSEGQEQLKILHIALRFDDSTKSEVKVFSVAELFGTSSFDGFRMEDCGCIAGDYLVYVSTMNPTPNIRQPWASVYKTNLKTGETNLLTPIGEVDLSPSVSPSGKKIAVASYQRHGFWDNESSKDLNTDIFVLNVDRPFQRKLVVRNGGWPTWGSEDIMFFHRKVGNSWGVFQANISNGKTTRVTPKEIDAMTPAAISATIVAVTTIRQKSQSSDVGAAPQNRHIEIFQSSGLNDSIKVTQKIRPKNDHFNPFVMDDHDGNKRIGYHRQKYPTSQVEKISKGRLAKLEFVQEDSRS